MCSEIVDQHVSQMMIKNIMDLFKKLVPSHHFVPSSDEIERKIQTYINFFPTSFKKANMIWLGKNTLIKSLLSLHLENQFLKMGYKVHKETNLFFLKENMSDPIKYLEMNYFPVEYSDVLIIDDAGQNYTCLTQTQLRMLHRIFSLREQLKLPYIFSCSLDKSNLLALFGEGMKKHLNASQCIQMSFE